MAGIRGVRSFMPPSRPKASKMFSGTDRSQPHADLQKSALKCHNNLGGMKNSVKASGAKQSSKWRGGAKNGGK